VNNERKSLIAVLAISACAAAPGRAAEYSGKRWELGIDPGLVYMVKGEQFAHDISNDQVANMLNTIGEGVAEEVAEGLAPIPSGGSVIASSVRPLAELAMHLDYRIDDRFTAGLEAGWGFKRDTHVDKEGIYAGHFLALRDEAQMFHVAPVGRIGRSVGPFRATLTAGPEMSVFWEHADITFTDPDDSIKPYTIVRQTTAFFGVLGGARVEWLCTENGSLQLGLEYHKMFAPDGKFDYVTPKAAFVARF